MWIDNRTDEQKKYDEMSPLKKRMLKKKALKKLKKTGRRVNGNKKASNPFKKKRKKVMPMI